MDNSRRAGRPKPASRRELVEYLLCDRIYYGYLCHTHSRAQIDGWLAQYDDEVRLAEGAAAEYQ